MNEEFRVLVCGGRDYNDKAKIYRVLDMLFQSTERPLVIIHGMARGADLIAGEWANDNNVDVYEFPAEWDKYNKRAGFVRNKQMLDEGNPHLVIAFPGGIGTKMMIDLANAYKVPMKKING